MTTLLLFQIIFFVIVILVTILFILMVFAPKNDEPDYERLYRMFVEQEEEDLKTLNIKNKEIDKIEEKILICKKKLGWKLFDSKKKDD